MSLPAGTDRLLETLRGLVDLYQNHIWKEDYLLFPLTNKVLSAEEQLSLCRQFEQVEARVGRDEHRRLEGLPATILCAQLLGEDRARPVRGRRKYRACR